MKDLKWIQSYKPARWKPMYTQRVQQASWVAERKENGWRVALTKQPSGKINAFSSSGRRLHELERSLGDVDLPLATMLDSEVVVVKPELCDCLRLGRDVGFDATSHFLANHPDGLEVRVFDLLVDYDNVTSWELKLRRNKARAYVHLLGHPRIKFVDWRAGNDPGLKEWIAWLRADGAEGVVFKDLTSTYKPGRRTVQWLKKKWELITWDVVITEILPPSEKLHPDWRRLAYGWSDGITRGVAPYQVHKDDADNYLGRVLEVQADELMPSGTLLYPRFVRWRDDKRAEECTP